ncbi:MAG: helix-hairpin-helix domain-containing protein [Deltaproteobacteria bacterium]|nr:helix-hairpin-helix domain-containing protein [Deltaproteobacteria bacterium]
MNLAKSSALPASSAQAARGARGGAPLTGWASAVLAWLALVSAALAPACASTAPTTVVAPEPPEPPAPAGPPLTVQVVDVGQGDGLIVLSPTGKSIMIDAGDRGKHAPMLRQLAEDGVTTLDLVVMSHPHADHIGGMQKVLEKVPTKAFVDPGFDYSSGIYADLLAHLEASGTKVLIARRGRRIDIGGGASLEVLWPVEPLLRGTRSDANSNSVVLKLVYGTTSMLFTGDSEAPTENGLLDDPESLHADVLKVAHHGSEHSTQDRFLAAVRPYIAVISCGEDNKFGHPALSTLEKLERSGVQVLRTDLSGTITLVSDGERWTTGVERGSVAAAPQVEVVDRGARRARAAAPAPAADKLDINVATAEDLRAVDGIGVAKAKAIIAYRDAHGPFGTMGELTRVDGIGAKTAAKIAEKFEVRGDGGLVDDAEPYPAEGPPGPEGETTP